MSPLYQLSPASLAILKGYLLSLIYPRTHQRRRRWINLTQPPLVIGDRRQVRTLGAPRRREDDLIRAGGYR